MRRRQTAAEKEIEEMEWNFANLIIPATCYGAGFVTALVLGLRHKVTDIFLSRSGLRVHTNSGDVVFEVMGRNERIDSSTRKSIRKGTTGLMLLDPNKYGTSMEVMLINHKAMLPLLYAAYENHHTRELASDGAEGYIADKVSDLAEYTKVWSKKFPALTDDLIEGFVCMWIKKALIPSLRKACYEKIDFYQSLLARTKVSDALKEEIKAWLAKNERYILRISELADCSAIREKSYIITEL
jgi:hypothetical protein